MAEVSALLVKRKVHDSTKYTASKNAALQFLYLPPGTVKRLGNPDAIEVVIRPASTVADQIPNTAIAVNGANDAARLEEPRTA